MPCSREPPPPSTRTVELVVKGVVLFDMVRFALDLDPEAQTHLLGSPARFSNRTSGSRALLERTDPQDRRSVHEFARDVLRSSGAHEEFLLAVTAQNPRR
jgi:hypothetical protein